MIFLRLPSIYGTLMIATLVAFFGNGNLVGYMALAAICGLWICFDFLEARDRQTHADGRSAIRGT